MDEGVRGGIQLTSIRFVDVRKRSATQDAEECGISKMGALTRAVMLPGVDWDIID